MEGLLEICNWILIIWVASYLLIVVHEAGHMLMARLVGVQVDEVNFGSMYPLISWKWRDTNFQILSFPAGGHTSMMDSGASGLSSRTKCVRLSIIVAGPLAQVAVGLTIIALVVSLNPELLLGDSGFIERLAASPWKLATAGAAAILIGLANFVPVSTWDGSKAIGVIKGEASQ